MKVSASHFCTVLLVAHSSSRDHVLHSFTLLPWEWATQGADRSQPCHSHVIQWEIMQTVKSQIPSFIQFFFSISRDLCLGLFRVVVWNMMTCESKELVKSKSSSNKLMQDSYFFEPCLLMLGAYNSSFNKDLITGHNFAEMSCGGLTTNKPT